MGAVKQRRHIERLAEGNPFMMDMARNLRQQGSLTENQLAATKAAVARIDAMAAARAAAQFVG